MEPSHTSPERPIQAIDEDEFERYRFVERLTAALINPTNNKSSGVVIGVTGPWGSGKSSILNLLTHHLNKKHADALVVRFDPWLISGRNDLIAEFFGELIGTINADSKRLARFKSIGATFAQYGSQFAPLGNLVLPGLGAIVSGGLKATETALSKKKSLAALRSNLLLELEALSSPIIVLIDELDRIEDEEIRAVAQLVRSIADFPGISYVLAYDADRVAQALGSGHATERNESGRAYLEKIVQLQIPIPAVFDDEIVRLLTSGLSKLKNEINLPDNFEEDQRYIELTQIIVGDVVQTPRDIRRLVGSFHVLASMLLSEVDWVDLLAYSSLLTKAPRTVAHMRREPDDFLNEPNSSRSMARYFAREKSSKDERINELIPEAERNSGTKQLLRFLFPWLAESGSQQPSHSDAFSQRRPLLTTLRLGLLPGAYSRKQVLEVLRGSPEGVETHLIEAQSKDSLLPLIDRIDDLYIEMKDLDHLSFWRGVEKFSTKPDCEWMKTFSPMNDIVRQFSHIMERTAQLNESLRREAQKIFIHLRDSKQTVLVSYWLRYHIFVHGLYDNQPRPERGGFFDKDQTEAIARELVLDWRTDHLAGKLIPCRWDLQPVYTMVDAGAWDNPCRNLIDDAIMRDEAIDSITLMLFGANYTTGRDWIKKFCDYDLYLDRVKERLALIEKHGGDETVTLSLNKALNGGW